MLNKEEKGLNMNNKAQGLSLNTIIIAILVLLVLVVLVAIFIGAVGNTGEQIARCENGGGVCILKTDITDTDKSKFGECGKNHFDQKRKVIKGKCTTVDTNTGEEKVDDAKACCSILG